MNQYRILLSAFILLVGLQNSYGQSVTPSTLNGAGGTGIAGGYTIDWSFGEMTMVNTCTTPSVIVTQGVLQPSLSPSLGVISNSNFAHDLQVFPNPANSIINLEYRSVASGSLSYRLMDLTGKIIVSNTKEVTQEITMEQLNISQLSAAIYMLEVTINVNGVTSKELSYKIEKLK
jgi:type IX secretion system substrate protein